MSMMQSGVLDAGAVKRTTLGETGSRTSGAVKAGAHCQPTNGPIERTASRTPDASDFETTEDKRVVLNHNAG